MRKIKYLKYLFKYLGDSGVVFYKKVWIYLVLFYFLSPIDLIPDPILGIGWLDDAVILIFSIIELVKILENYAKEKERPSRSQDGKTIDDVEYKVHDD